jgi:hypothetical protein
VANTTPNNQKESNYLYRIKQFIMDRELSDVRIYDSFSLGGIVIHPASPKGLPIIESSAQQFQIPLKSIHNRPSRFRMIFSTWLDIAKVELSNSWVFPSQRGKVQAWSRGSNDSKHFVLRLSPISQVLSDRITLTIFGISAGHASLAT